MIDDIKKLKDGCIIFQKMNRISKNGCTDDDYIYSAFLLGQEQILNMIVDDLNKIIKKYGDEDE